MKNRYNHRPHFTTINHHQPPQPLNQPPQPLNQPPLPPPLPPQSHYSNYENTLLNEVLYLHALWHRGPPNPHPHPHPHHRHLKPNHTTHFKKPHTRHVSDKEWPVPVSIPTDSGSGWPAFPSNNQPLSRPATAGERAAVLGVKIQQRGVDFTRSLFRCEDDDVDDADVDDDDVDDDGEDETEFFERLFNEDKELREFYKNNCEGVVGREFYCLICGKNNNLGRKYINCVALIQHSLSILKTKKKAHRAYGSVVCKVVGWDLDSLPSMSNPVAVVEDEVKNHADENAAGAVEMERDAPLTKPSQIEMPDAHQENNVTCTDDGGIAIQKTQTEGEVKTQSDVNNTAVGMEGDDVDAGLIQAEPAGVPNAFEKDNCASVDAGCIASALTHSEGEQKDSADGCKVDTPDSEKDRVSSVNAVPEQENNPELDRVDGAKTSQEECPVLGSMPGELEAGNDPFEHLQCLPGVFLIPE